MPLFFFFLWLHNATKSWGSRDSLLVRAPDLWSKGCEFECRQELWDNFAFSRDNFVCWHLFGVSSTSLLPQWHINDPSHSAKSASGSLQLNTHRSFTQWSQSGLKIYCCPGIMLEPIPKQADAQLVREHSVTVISARWAAVDWSWPNKWKQCARDNLHLKKKKKARAGK